ncbi:hypothetical protein FBULB1_11461 [Fusarium bulbicola]|nr:hypothetical protein FBULB1_11461 [Fusarium bulbicola]
MLADSSLVLEILDESLHRALTTKGVAMRKQDHYTSFTALPQSADFLVDRLLELIPHSVGEVPRSDDLVEETTVGHPEKTFLRTGLPFLVAAASALS